MKKETFKQFQRGLHCGQISFDQLAKWYYELKTDTEILYRDNQRLLKEAGSFLMEKYSLIKQLKSKKIDQDLIEKLKNKGDFHSVGLSHYDCKRLLKQIGE